MKQLLVGWAQESITPIRPVIVVGQMFHRVSEYVRDPITATALALDNGEAQAVLVSLDMTEFPTHVLPLLFERLADLTDLHCENISVNVTHTHNSSDFFTDFLRDDNERVYGKDILPEIDLADDVLAGEEAQTFLAEHLSNVVRRAWEGRKKGGVAWAHDYAAVAFSRRPVFAHASGEETIMYGDCSRDDFVRFEAGTDSAAEMLYTFDENANVTGVAVNVPCPSQVFELHRFITADYWGHTRAAIRRKLGNVYVLSLCGAAGDLAPLDLVAISKYNKQALLDWGGQAKEVFRNFDMTLLCEGIAARITDAVVRGYDYARNYIEYTPAFMHEVVTLELPLRLVKKEEYEASAKEVAHSKASFSKEHRMTMEDVVKAFEPQGDVLRWELQQKTQTYACKSHIMRIGDVAVATNPFELYHEFAQRMKARVSARQLFVVQLANGLGGYLPSQIAIKGGSYSSKPASTTCGPDGGDTLVEQTVRIVNGMFCE